MYNKNNFVFFAISSYTQIQLTQTHTQIKRFRELASKLGNVFRIIKVPKN